MLSNGRGGFADCVFFFYFFSQSIMSTFRPGKYLVIAPVKCFILQDISLFKIGDINLIAIQTITHFKIELIWSWSKNGDLLLPLL